MSGKKTLTVITIILLILLYLNYGDNTLKPKVGYSEKINDATKENDKLLSKTSALTNEQVHKTKVKKSEDYGIFACLPEISFDEEARRENISQQFKSLSDSFTKAEPLYYALYATPPEGETKLDLLFDYYDKLPNNPIVSMDLISLCVNSQDKRCSIDFIAEATDSDGKNGAIWVNTISFYAAKGDSSKVLDSIYSLERTSLFNERFGEKALLYAQALEGSSSSNFNTNAIAGIGKSASTFPTYSPIIQWCEQNLDESDKANACLTLGEQLETRSKTQISKAIGIALQSMVFKSQGNTDAVQLSDKKRKELTPNSENDLYQKASIMLMLDERLMRGWLNNLDFYGEVESQQLLVEEAVVLYEENEHYLCTLEYEISDGF